MKDYITFLDQETLETVNIRKTHHTLLAHHINRNPVHSPSCTQLGDFEDLIDFCCL